MGGAIGLIVAGAVLYWAVNINVPFVFDGALGVILMVGGAIAVVATVAMHMQSPRARRTRDYDTYA